ncbi:MAG TPA: ferrous iron transporter B [Caulobacteraceae bacterium]|nr:ferrous iron transporter B [Caulobacteraceae bacterium]
MTKPVSPPAIRVALVGNPNSGKTALFNALTGGRQKVANYAGVTVERKEGSLIAPSGRKIMVLDLPGTYSLRARSPDEEVTRDVVLGRRAGEAKPDLFICVADASNLRLVLRLALELKQTGQPMVLVLNMIDIAERQGLRIDLAALSREIGAPVTTTVAVRKRGIDDLVALIDGADPQPSGEGDMAWRAPTAKDIREAHREAERILKVAVKPPERPDTWTGRLDDVLLHPVWGGLILTGILFFMFQAVFSWATPIMDLISAGFAGLSGLVNAHMPHGELQSLISNGLISGVGSVVVFLPQIMILFLFIILLEDFGYMARAAFLMDKVMGGAGLHGRAFIPLLSSFACAIPGIMATRVIDQRRDRLTTILVAPLMTCSARIPVYTLIISAFIPRRTLWGWINLQGLVMFGLYAAGAISALLVAFVFRRIFWRGPSEPFIMELPSYKAPDARNVIHNVLLRAQIFLKRAGTTILSMMILIWFLSSVPGAPAGAKDPPIDYSFAGMIGHAMLPLLAPIGFNWQMSVALVPGMAAREVVVGALGTVYAVGEDQPGRLANTLAGHWSLATALSFLAWYVFAPQCASTLAVIRRETNSWKWSMATFVYMLALAYGAAFVVYQIASRL